MLENFADALVGLGRALKVTVRVDNLLDSITLFKQVSYEFLRENSKNLPQLQLLASGRFWRAPGRSSDRVGDPFCIQRE